MKQIKFLNLYIQNFKKIEVMDIKLNEQTSIFGENGSGKTTIADAISFVLFNKDMFGNAPVKAGLKRVDNDGKEIPELIMIVKLEMLVDGVKVILERKQEENWAVTRGTSQRVFKGNVQTLSVNESVVKNAEYSQTISSIIEEDMFKLLTNPHFFMNEIEQKQRREMLMNFIGNDADIEETIKLKHEYIPLMEEWNNDMNRMKSLTTFKEYLVKKSKTDKEELVAIPEKIQALQKSIGDAIDVEEINKIIYGYNVEIENIDKEINKPASIPSWVSEYQDKANDLLQKANDLKVKSYNDKVSEVSEGLEKKKDMNSRLFELKHSLNRSTENKENASKQLSETDVRLIKMRSEWETITLETFTAPDFEKVCSHCGQELPKEGIEEHLKEAEELFNKSKENRKNKLAQEGKELNGLKSELENVINYETELIEKLQININTLTEQLVPFENIVMPQMVETEEVISLKNEAQELLDKVEDFRKTITAENENNELKSRKSILQSLVGDAHRKLGRVDQQEQTKKQILEEEAKEKKLLEQKIHYEILINLVDDFEHDKNKAFENELSKHFDTVKWQLFEPQANGGFKQVCEPLLNGKNWTQQSVGEQIFSGIDIIKAFQKRFEIVAPIIIDNRESLTIPIDTESQTISMYVESGTTAIKIA